jgi:hypothetical protein
VFQPQHMLDPRRLVIRTLNRLKDKISPTVH